MYTHHTLWACFIAIGIFFTGCHSRPRDAENPKDSATVTLDSESVSLFARALEQSVNNDRPTADLLNSAFDRQAVREKLSRNSDVASALDMDFGQKIFEDNLNYGDHVVGIINGGGHFRFDTCYRAGGEFHIVFRIYDTLGATHFDDYSVEARGNELKITEGFSFDNGCKLTTKISSEILYNALKMTGNLDASARTIEKVAALNKEGKYAEMLKILKENPDPALHYPAYNTYYLIGIRNCSSRYIADLHKLRETGVNERFILAHELNYYAETADFEAIKNTIDRLIAFTGDDPVFCIQAAKTLTLAKRPEDALQFYNVAKQAMPYIWDIWKGELACYRLLNDEKNYRSCLEAGKKLYGLSDTELSEIEKGTK